MYLDFRVVSSLLVIKSECQVERGRKTKRCSLTRELQQSRYSDRRVAFVNKVRKIAIAAFVKKVFISL